MTKDKDLDALYLDALYHLGAAAEDEAKRNLVQESTAEAIACMADEHSKQWVANGVRLAAGQGNPFPQFAADIRKRFGR